MWGGDPDRTRTCYLKIRNLALYPDELRDHFPGLAESYFPRHIKMRRTGSSAHLKYYIYQSDVRTQFLA